MNKTSFQYIYKHIKEKNMLAVYKGSLYLKNEKEQFYKLIPKEKEKNTVNNMIDVQVRDKIVPKMIISVIDKLYMDEDFKLDEKNINPKHLLNVKNGVLDLKDLKLLPKYSDRVEKYIFTYQINANYLLQEELPEAKKENFIKFLKTVLNDDKEKKYLFLSIIGYVLTDFKEARAMFFLIGSTATGKSVIATFLTKLIGEEYITGLTLSNISKQFGLNELKNSRINISTETNTAPIKDTGTLKAIISCDRMFADQKNKEGINFRPTCKMIQIGNHVPELKNDNDEGNAFKDRFVILKFNNTISKEDRNLELEDNLLLEMDFIFTIAINTFKEKVMDNNFIFPQPEESLRFIESYFDSTSDLDKVNMFINSKCEFGTSNNYREYIDDLYNSYLKYIFDEKLKSDLTRIRFTKILEELLVDKGVKKSRFRKDNKNQYGFIGIKLIG